MSASTRTRTTASAERRPDESAYSLWMPAEQRKRLDELIAERNRALARQGVRRRETLADHIRQAIARHLASPPPLPAADLPPLPPAG